MPRHHLATLLLTLLIIVSAWNRGADIESAANIAKITGAATGLATGDVNAASNSSATAVDNNLIPLIIGAMMVEAYWISQVDEDGSAINALEKIGDGKDTLSETTKIAIEKGVELSYEKYPEATIKVLEAIESAAEKIDASVTYVDEKTGKVVSSNWNSLSESTRKRIKGGVGLVSLGLSATATTSIVKAIGPKVPAKIGGKSFMVNKIYTEKEVRRLADNNRGLIFVEESPRGKAAAIDFQEGTNGAMSHIPTQKPAVPALRFDNPNGLNYIKFDGFEPLPNGGILLIDAKTNLPFWSKGGMENISKTLNRIEDALKQNPGYKVVYEFPDAKTAAKASKFIEGIEKANTVSIRVRGD